MFRKKVLIDLYSLETPNCGFGQIAINYAKRFAEIQRAGKEKFDICFIIPKSLKGSKEFEGVKCYFRRTTKYWWHRLKWRFPNVDVWHSVNQHTPHAPRFSHTKRIFTIHDYNFLFEEKDEQKRKECLSLMQQQIDNSAVITFISKYTENLVREYSHLEGKQTALIYDGVEDLTTKPSARPAFVNTDKPFFFAIGQFFEKKKFDLLLDVMKCFPDRELYICGQNDFRYGQMILRRIEKEHITNVHAPGFVTPEERVWLFSHCEAYLFPSIGEGFGLPAIEAMQFGKPVFASSFQSLPEIVGNYGYIWPTLEPDSMADVVKKGLADFYRDKTKAEQVKAYAQTFSYEKHIEAYLQLYRKLLNL